MHTQFVDQEKRLESEIGELDLRLQSYVGRHERRAQHASSYLRELVRYKRGMLGTLRARAPAPTTH